MRFSEVTVIAFLSLITLAPAYPTKFGLQIRATQELACASANGMQVCSGGNMASARGDTATTGNGISSASVNGVTTTAGNDQATVGNDQLTARNSQATAGSGQAITAGNGSECAGVALLAGSETSSSSAGTNCDGRECCSGAGSSVTTGKSSFVGSNTGAAPTKAPAAPEWPALGADFNPEAWIATPFQAAGVKAM